MLSLLRTRYTQFAEHCQEHGFWSACKIVLYKYEEAVPVEKDLTALKPLKPPGIEYEVLELTRDNVSAVRYPYTFRSRKERVARYLNKGYQSFVLVHNERIIGDIWYVTHETARQEPPHPHLFWFQIPLRKNEVYMFDMFVDPAVRGNAVTTYFMNKVLHIWNSRGFAKSYGYFVADYVPALWIHRMLGYKEMPHHIVKRYFMIETVRKKAA